jgi:hypothetical protein
MTQIQKTILNEEIKTLIEAIREQSEMLNTFEGKIPILEFEIIKNNVRKLYEKLCLLQRMNDPFEISRQKEQEIHGVPPPIPSKENKTEETASGLPFMAPVQTNEDVNEPYETEAEPVKIDLPSSETPVQTLAEKDNPSEIKTEALKIDLFTSETNAFNEKLKEAREQSLGPRFRPLNTGDIKSLININEKFLFINELFDGDYKEYTHTIETFNTFSEKSEAFDFLDSLLKNNLWNSTSKAFLKLKETVEKRFT